MAPTDDAVASKAAAEAEAKRLGKYNLKDHVLSDASYPTRSAWATMDCCILTWVYCTISNAGSHRPRCLAIP
jgi:hypothetical protein